MQHQKAILIKPIFKIFYPYSFHITTFSPHNWRVMSLPVRTLHSSSVGLSSLLVDSTSIILQTLKGVKTPLALNWSKLFIQWENLLPCWNLLLHKAVFVLDVAVIFYFFSLMKVYLTSWVTCLSLMAAWKVIQNNP